MRLIVANRYRNNFKINAQFIVGFTVTVRVRVHTSTSGTRIAFVVNFCLTTALPQRGASERWRCRCWTATCWHSSLSSSSNRPQPAPAAQMPSAKRQSAGAWRQQQQPQNITGRQSDRCNSNSSTSNILGSCCPPRVPHRACSFAVSFSHSLGQRIRCAAHCLLGYVAPLCSESFPALSFSRHKQSF